MVKIAILGFGTVGTGVFEVVTEQDNLEVARIKVPHYSPHLGKPLFTAHIDDIIDDKEISIVVECIGGVTDAYDYTIKALTAGKHVITSNKELVAEHGKQLKQLAKNQKVKYYYEASVGGGIPIIRPLANSLAGEKISEIFGILNGTTNYILTQMANLGQSFQTALEDAKRLGYAEADPTDDIEGFDTKRKIKILADLAFKEDIPLEAIETEGISQITLQDIKAAQSKGCSLKLIGHAKREIDGKITCSVKPMEIDRSDALYGVNDVFNGIKVSGEPIGEVMFYGRGAGKFPTASAVLADIIEIAKEIS